MSSFFHYTTDLIFDRRDFIADLVQDFMMMVVVVMVMVIVFTHV